MGQFHLTQFVILILLWFKSCFCYYADESIIFSLELSITTLDSSSIYVIGIRNSGLYTISKSLYVSGTLSTSPADRDQLLIPCESPRPSIQPSMNPSISAIKRQWN